VTAHTLSENPKMTSLEMAVSQFQVRAFTVTGQSRVCRYWVLPAGASEPPGWREVEWDDFVELQALSMNDQSQISSQSNVRIRQAIQLMERINTEPDWITQEALLDRLWTLLETALCLDDQSQ